MEKPKRSVCLWILLVLAAIVALWFVSLTTEAKLALFQYVFGGFTG